jgi:hypothetical protein
MSADHRFRARRRRDTEHRVTHDIHVWWRPPRTAGFRISLRRIQAWREVNELPARELMRDGRRLV